VTVSVICWFYANKSIRIKIYWKHAHGMTYEMFLPVTRRKRGMS
jgi:hypothetical protein